ncbi:MAG: DUF1761 domain-containing protein [Bacteroidia bacterium]|nr:DUF1761 domain-containing protein [Bacteroidia bacterium]MBT8310533.1 DUF1761 domain-containing protein [Bacteroidia bacterium]NND09611.1 DUF1761 domain-containing protein [Flavobacteriaceae bacterium]NNK27328.1 DUF1761 domain-containing protein [Flavobacteriaceae bacterium]NNL61452.1 DUF1761 domain-containing protein [Flavobacteriaceae bacterium]
MENVNWISMVIATFIPMVVGFVYYNPKVFGNAWMKSLGITEEDIKKQNMAKTYGIAIVMSFILAFFLLNFNNSPGQEGEFDTFKHGAFHGLFLTIVVAMPILMTNGLFELKNLKNIFINIGYWLITLVLMGGVLDAMNHWPNVAA